MAEPHELVSDAGRNALGYLGGGILALSLVPQIIRLLMTKSAEDISLLWSLLYFLGTSLSFLYLVLIGALAAWIPVVIEMCGCIITIALKLMYDHTDWGKQQQMLLEAELLQQDGMEAQRLVLDSASHTALKLQQQLTGNHVDPTELKYATEQKVQHTMKPDEREQQLPFQYQYELGPPEGLSTPHLPRPALQHLTQERAGTKKKVVINVPLTAGDEQAATTAAQCAAPDGEVVLTIGDQLSESVASKLRGPTFGPSAFNSLSTSAVNSPRSDGVPASCESNRSRRWQAGASARKLPWYMTTGISHHSVLKTPRSPGGVAASSPCRCPTCGQRCLPPTEVHGTVAGSPSRRAWINSLFSPGSTAAGSAAASAPATPRGKTPPGSALSGISRQFVRTLLKFGSGNPSRWPAAEAASATPEMMSPQPGATRLGSAAVAGPILPSPHEV